MWWGACSQERRLEPHSYSRITRKAKMTDIPAMLSLINGYAAEGVMLPRTEFELSECIRDFTVIYDGNSLLGCAALHFYSPMVAELRSLAVSREARSTGAGRQLVEAIEVEAREFDLQSVFAFTYVPDFFAKMGYELVDRNELPLKAWKDCLRCPKFQACDEIAVLRKLKPQSEAVQQREALRILPGDTTPGLAIQPYVIPHPTGY
ncbi:MAG: N-acetyltransferase [Acidobacteriota bacterium]